MRNFETASSFAVVVYEAEGPFTHTRELYSRCILATCSVCVCERTLKVVAKMIYVQHIVVKNVFYVFLLLIFL